MTKLALHRMTIRVAPSSVFIRVDPWPHIMH
jgi:hypothetical protein